MTLIEPYKPMLHFSASAVIALLAYRKFRRINYTPLESAARAALISVAAGCMKEISDSTGLTAAIAMNGDSLGGTARIEDLLIDYAGTAAGLYAGLYSARLYDLLNSILRPHYSNQPP